MTRGPWRISTALTLPLGLLLAISSAAVGVLIHTMVESTLIRQAINEVQATAQGAGRQLTDELRAHRSRSLAEDVADIATGGTFVMITTRSGRFELSNGPTPPTLPVGGWVNNPSRGWFLYDGSPYAYARVPLDVAGTERFLFVVRDERSQANLTAALDRILLWAGALLVVVLWAGVLLSVQRITQPLGRLRAFAQRVARNPLLHERLPASTGLYEVDALTLSLHQMLERIELGQERERQFASHAAHALRTPVQVIRGYLQTLARWGGTDEAVRQKALRALVRESAGMETLIERLLTLSSLEGADAATLQPVSLSELFSRIREDLQDTCPRHALRIEEPRDLTVQAEPELLHTVLRILVENADAYADPMSEVLVSAAAAPGGAEIQVTNHGPSIPAEILPHLFERFHRGHQPSDSGHFGLGLAIADKMVEQMHGIWRVESRDGVTVFAFWLSGQPLPGRGH